MAGEGADGHLAAGLADVAQLDEPADVDEHRRRRQPQLHEREQRVAAGQQLGLVAVLAQELDRLLGRAGPYVVERRRDHPWLLPDRDRLVGAAPVDAARIAAHTRCGEAGMSMSVTPNGASASTTAFITAGVDAIGPASPMPFPP